jgi:hypothetical protein
VVEEFRIGNIHQSVRSLTGEATTKMNKEDAFDHEGWAAGGYTAPDYVPGSHPMDKDEVTFHHIWEKKPPSKEE